MQNQESIFDKNYKGEEDVYDGVKLNNSILSDRSNCVDGASPLQPEKIIDVLDVECKTSENLSTVENIDENTGKPRSHILEYSVIQNFSAFLTKSVAYNFIIFVTKRSWYHFKRCIIPRNGASNPVRPSERRLQFGFLRQSR